MYGHGYVGYPLTLNGRTVRGPLTIAHNPPAGSRVAGGCGCKVAGSRIAGGCIGFLFNPIPPGTPTWYGAHTDIRYA